MEKEPEHPEEQSKPPPPDLRMAPPPPSPPAAADPPPSRQPDAAPPVQIGPRAGTGSGGNDESEDEIPGADASLANRAIAAVIDSVIAGGIVLGLSIFVGFLPDFLGFFRGALSRVIYFAGFGYFLTRDSLPFLGGQSVGKKAMGIRAVTTDGRSLSGNWQPGVVRNIAFLIPPFALVELFVLISRQDKQPLLRLGDEWAKTKVINAGDEATGSASQIE